MDRVTIRRHIQDLPEEDKAVHVLNTPGGPQKMTFLGIQHLLQEQAIFKKSAQKSAAGHEEQSIGRKIIRVGPGSQGRVPGGPTFGKRSFGESPATTGFARGGTRVPGGVPGGSQGVPLWERGSPTPAFQKWVEVDLKVLPGQNLRFRR